MSLPWTKLSWKQDNCLKIGDSAMRCERCEVTWHIYLQLQWKTMWILRHLGYFFLNDTIMIMIACRTTLFLATGACTIIRLSLLIIREWIAQLLILFWEYKTPNATFSCKQLYFAYISAYNSTTLRIDWILYLKYTVCCNRAIAYALLRMYLYILLRNISFFFFC